MTYLKFSDFGLTFTPRCDCQEVSIGPCVIAIIGCIEGDSQDPLPPFAANFKTATTWWLEVDDAGNPTREIGFDKHGRPIVFGPVDASRELWTNLGVALSEFATDPFIAARFEEVWKRLQTKPSAG